MALNYFQFLLFALVFLEASVYVGTLDCWLDSTPTKEENAWKVTNPNGTWNGIPGLMIKPVTCTNTSHDCIYFKCYKTIKRVDVYYKEVGCGVPKNCTGAVEKCKQEANKANPNLFGPGQLPEVVCNSCHGNMCNKDENGTMSNGAVGKDVGIGLNTIMMGLLMVAGVEVLLGRNGAKLD